VERAAVGPLCRAEFSMHVLGRRAWPRVHPDEEKMRGAAVQSATAADCL
jgi:hypothetical protein